MRRTPALSEARLTHDPGLRAAVEAARAWGVPPSVLRGRVVRDGQPLWTAEDTSLALALQAVEARRCQCGEDRVTSTSPDAEFAYVAEPIRCHACATRDRAANAFSEAGGSPAGLLWSVRRKPEPEPDSP